MANNTGHGHMHGLEISWSGTCPNVPGCRTQKGNDPQIRASMVGGGPFPGMGGEGGEPYRGGVLVQIETSMCERVWTGWVGPGHSAKDKKWNCSRCSWQGGAFHS